MYSESMASEWDKRWTMNQENEGSDRMTYIFGIGVWIIPKAQQIKCRIKLNVSANHHKYIARDFPFCTKSRTIALFYFCDDCFGHAIENHQLPFRI